MGELLAVSALIMFSANIILTKVASARVSVEFGFLVSVVVNVLFAFLLVVVQFALRDDPFRVDFLALFIFLLAGFFSTYLGRWLFYDSVVRLGPSRASTFQVSNPMFTVLIAWIFLGERLSATDVAAATAILAGLFLVSYRPSQQELDMTAGQPPAQDLRVGQSEASKRSTMRSTILNAGTLLALSGALSYAVGNVLRGIAIQDWNEPIVGGLAGAITGLTVYALFSPAIRRLSNSWRSMDRGGLYLYAVGGILTISAQISMIAAMRYIPVSIATLITLSTPVLVTPVGYFLLKNHEGITVRSLAGSAFVLGGVGAILVT